MGFVKRACVMLVVLVFLLFLTGCTGGHYTEDIRKEYEKSAFAGAEEVLLAITDDPESVSYELYLPDGVTHVVTGRFLYSGYDVQYVYDGDSGRLWASRTEGGFAYGDAREYILSEVSGFLDGTGMRADGIRSLSWRIPYKEYQYAVKEEEGKTVVANSSHPSEHQGWLHRPYFEWAAGRDDVEAFLDSLLHGSPDAISDLSVVVLCSSFEDEDVQDELARTGILNAFSGIRSVRIYEDSDGNRYYEEAYGKDGEPEVTCHERKVDGQGTDRWTTSRFVPPDAGEEG